MDYAQSYATIQFWFTAGPQNKIIAIDDISIAAGHCDDIDEAFPPDNGPNICSVYASTDDGKI